jgi:NitT/TauT family transport system substrate-binding protein
MPINRIVVRVVAAAALAVAGPIGVVGCGGGGDDTAPTGPSKDNPVSIKVGDVEGAPASFLNFGVQKGLFAEHGLTVTVVQQQGGAAIIPGLVSGDLQFGGSNVVSMLLARDRGLKVQIVAPGTSVGTDPGKDFSAVVVAGDSRIATAKDLAGKTIAVNTLKNVNEVVLKSYLEAHGVEPTALKYIELGFPDMLAAITQHRVDAALVIEPFATVAQSQGARVLFHPYVEAKPNLGVGTYSATEKYVQDNPAVVKAFRQAAAQTAAYITAHPDEYRAALPKIAKVQADLASRVNIPVWNDRIDTASLQFFADRMVKYGLVKSKPDVTAAVAP